MVHDFLHSSSLFPRFSDRSIGDPCFSVGMARFLRLFRGSRTLRSSPGSTSPRCARTRFLPGNGELTLGAPRPEFAEVRGTRLLTTGLPTPSLKDHNHSLYKSSNRHLLSFFTVGFQSSPRILSRNSASFRSKSRKVSMSTPTGFTGGGGSPRSFNGYGHHLVGGERFRSSIRLTCWRASASCSAVGILLLPSDVFFCSREVCHLDSASSSSTAGGGFRVFEDSRISFARSLVTIRTSSWSTIFWLRDTFHCRVPGNATSRLKLNYSPPPQRVYDKECLKNQFSKCV